MTRRLDLLGNFSSPGAAHGFLALFELQVAQTKVWQDRLTSDDAMFHRPYLWTDRNHDAVADEGEIPPFGEQFSAILFFASLYNRNDGHGNRFAWQGTALTRTAPGKNPTLNSRDSPSVRGAYTTYSSQDYDDRRMAARLVSDANRPA